MKPTQIAELLANIKKTFVSFFSILMFVTLGVGVFVGISWTAPAVQSAANALFDEGTFHHFQVQFPYGLTDDDMQQLSKIEGVTQLEAGRQSFQTVTTNDSHYTVKVQSVGEDIDTLTVKSGELPQKTGEIALFYAAAERLGWDVGDVIAFEKDVDDDDMTLSGDTGSTEESSSAKADDDGMKFLNRSAFKITALVESPEYIAILQETYGTSTAPSGMTDAIGWILPDDFDGSAFQGGYPIVNVRCESLTSLNTYSDEYKQASSSIEGQITELGDTLATARYDDLHGRAQEQIDGYEAQLKDAQEKVASGERELEEGREKLETERAEGEAKLADAYQQLLYYENQKAWASSELAAAREKVAYGEAALNEADAAKAEIAAVADDASAFKAEQDEKLEKGEITQKEHDKALDEYGKSVTDRLQPYASRVGYSLPAIDHTNFDLVLSTTYTIIDQYEDIPIPYEGEEITIGEARERLEEGRRQIADGEAQLYSAEIQLNNGWAEYYAGQNELNTRVADAEQQLADGEQQIEDTKALIAEKEPLLEEAKEKLSAMSKYDWTILPRAYNAGAIQISTFSDVTTNLSLSMAALFIIVGLLVSYSAVSRIVHEQVVQIGTKKALGLRSREITLSFLLYSGLAVVSGAIIGSLIGFILVEGIIGHALGSMFVFGDYPGYFGWGLFLIVTALELLLVLGATWFACRAILREHAVVLLRGKKPPEGKTRFYEKWAIFDKLPLFTQTLINNCVNDKRRMFSTLVGVAGCTALIVTAFTLNDDVLKSYDRHYEDVYGFNVLSYVDSSIEGAADAIDAKLGEEGAETALALRETMAFTLPDGSRGVVNAIVPADAEQFSQVYHVHSVSDTDFDSSADGAWVSQAYAEHFGAKVGDNIVLSGADGKTHEVPILGFYEFWLTYHEMVMGRDYYESEFGEFAPNVVFANTGDTAVEEIEPAVSKIDGFDSIIDDKIYQHGNFETFSSVSSTVVLIYVVLAVLMAIVVLLNLNVMFIEEKKRELIVLMINGFSVHDAKRYIYNDNIVLTALGIILGVVLGCIMGAITVGSIEPSTASFVKSVDWLAVGVGIVGSAVLAAIMTVIALRRIPRFALTDINKL